MDINLNKLVGKKTAQVMRKNVLHKIAGAIERNRGEDIEGDLDLPNAIKLIGKKAYLKDASKNRILHGLRAMNDILEEV